MALKLRIAKLEEVDEAVRSLYVQKGDGFELDAEDIGKIDEFRSNNRTMKEELDAWKALGLSPDQAKEMIAAARKKKADDEKGKLTVQELEAKYSGQVAELETKSKEERAILQAKIDRYEILEPMRQAALKAGVIPADVEDLLELPSIKRRYRRGENGKIQILDVDGDPDLSATPEKFFEQMRKERPRFFSPNGSTGSGSKPSEARPHPDGVREVSDRDQDAMNANLEDIASGKVVVVSASD